MCKNKPTKIAILGYSGSGKSTLARRLGAQYPDKTVVLRTPGALRRLLQTPDRHENRA